MKKTNNLRIAVIGGGYWGKNLVRNFSELGVLHAVCDSNTETVQRLKELYPEAEFHNSPEAIFSDPNIEAVAIATPAESHGAMVKKALESGKDVFVEKPLCLSEKEAEQLVAMNPERILMVGHLLWYHPAIVKLKQLIDGGDLGRIQYIYSNRLNLGKIRREENILWSFAPHDISVILGLVGEMPTNVQTQGGNYLHQQIADATVSLLSFPSGVKAHIFVSWLHPFKEQKLIVVGDKKMAVFNDMESKEKLVLYPHSIDWKNQMPVANKAEGLPVELSSEEPLRAECSHFIESIQTRQLPRTDGAEGLRVLKVLQQCQSSMEQNQKVASDPKSYFAHESAFIDDDVTIGDDTTIWHTSHILKGSNVGSQCRIGQNVVIGPNVSVGDGVKIQNNVSVYEGVELEDSVFCGPSMVFTNVSTPRSHVPRNHEFLKTLVKRGATLGANCTIVCGHTIGRYSFVGAGAVVTKDVPDHALVVGNPAKVVGWVCECGLKLKGKDAEQFLCECGEIYKKDESGNLLSLDNPVEIKS